MITCKWTGLERTPDDTAWQGACGYVAHFSSDGPWGAGVDICPGCLKSVVEAHFCESCGAEDPGEIEGNGLLDNCPRSECCNDWIVDIDGNPKGLEGA